MRVGCHDHCASPVGMAALCMTAQSLSGTPSFLLPVWVLCWRGSLLSVNLVHMPVLWLKSDRHVATVSQGRCRSTMY